METHTGFLKGNVVLTDLLMYVFIYLFTISQHYKYSKYKFSKKRQERQLYIFKKPLQNHVPYEAK